MIIRFASGGFGIISDAHADAPPRPICEGCGRRVSMRVAGLCAECRSGPDSWTCKACGERKIATGIDGVCVHCYLAANRRNTNRARSARPAPQAAPTAALARHAHERRVASAELKASSEGEQLGRLHGHDPQRLARAIGANVAYLPSAEIQDPTRPNFTRYGYSFKPTKAIVVASDRPAREIEKTLTHECAHLLNLDVIGDFVGERHCDFFAMAFLKVHDDEVPGYAERQALERAQREAGERARARR